MRKTITLIAALFAVWAMAEENPVAPLQYDMTFKGRGESTTVQTVTVENLTLGTSLELNGSDVLRLTNAVSTGIEPISNAPKVHSVIYPNPSFGAANLIFANRAASNVQITVTDLMGRIWTRGSFHLETGKQTAVLPAMQQGQYIVTLSGKGINESVKWMSTGGGTGGTIRMEGNTSAPLSLSSTVYSPVIPSQTRAANTVEMEYNDGELLRFTGVSGNMTTIVMSTPTLSHDITFDFYECKDAAGRYYPIVYAGGYMWMAEDLGATPSVVPVTTNATDWGANAAQAQAAFENFGSTGDAAYYNLAGAKAALPEGWSLPTANDWSYMRKYAVSHLTSDTLGLVLEAGGYIRDYTGYQSSDITFISDGSYYWSSSTKSTQSYSNMPIHYQLTGNYTSFVVTNSNGKPANCGYRVRGIRPAITPYKELNMLFAGANDPQGSPRTRAANASAAGFQGLPLGEKWTSQVDVELNMPVIPHINSSTVTPGYGRAYDLHGYNFIPNTTPTGTNNYTNCFSNYNTDDHEVTGRPMKMVVQNTASGRQNILIARWLKSDGTYANGLGGAGVVDLYILAYDYTTKQYKRVSAYGKRLSGFMPDRGAGTFNSFLDYNTLFHITCADMNNDNTEDVIIAIGDKVVIYDGTDYATVITSRTFPDAVKRDIAVAVGDVDEDGTLDVAVTYSLNNFLYNASNGFDRYETQKIEVFKNGLHDGTADYSYIGDTYTYPPNKPEPLVYDIKIGKIGTSTFPRIVVLSKHGVALFRYGGHANPADNVNLNRVGIYDTYNIDHAVTPDPIYVNREIVFARLRGNGYPLDMILPAIRLVKANGTNYDVTRRTMLYRDDQWITDNSLPIRNLSTTPGSIAAGNFMNDPLGKEQLLYNAVTLVDNQKMDGGNTLIFSEDNEVYNGIHCGALVSQIGNMSNNVPFWQLPVAAPRIGEKVTFQFKQHDITMSNPTIYALLAAPPYYKENPNGTPYTVPYSMGTSWGKTVSSATTKSEYSSESSTDVVGINCTFAIPVFDFITGGSNWTKEMAKEWGTNIETKKMIEYSTTYTAENQHCVVLSAYYYDHYTYEAVAGNPDIVGSTMNISIPYGYEMMRITLDDYNRVRADKADIPDVNPFFKTYDIEELGGGWKALNGTPAIQPGYPFTYPKKATDIINLFSDKLYKPTCDDAGTIVGNYLECGFVGIGSGGPTEKQITVQEGLLTEEIVKRNTAVEQSSTFGWYNSGHTDGGNKEIARGYEVTNGLTVGGQVSGLRTLGENGLPNFNFNLVWYYGSVNGQVFPIVNYLVKE